MKRMWAVLCGVLLLTAAAPAVGQAPGETPKGELAVVDAVVRVALGKGRTTAGYMTIRNEGDRPDRLTGASTPAAERVELHSSAMTDGVMRMRPLDGLEVPADGSVALDPGGSHLMLIGLVAPLAVGARVELTLIFERAGEVRVPAHVIGMRAPIPSAAGEGGMRGHAHH